MRADRRYVLAILIAYGLAGVALPWSPDDAHGLGPVALVLGAVLSFLCFAWCKAHAQAFGMRPPYAAAFLMGAAAPIGLPYYSFRAFGLMQGTWLCLKGLALLVCATLLAGVGATVSALVHAQAGPLRGLA